MAIRLGNARLKGEWLAAKARVAKHTLGHFQHGFYHAQKKGKGNNSGKGIREAQVEGKG
jgi:hypothetical protein